jgi:hypothetical protein
MFGFGDDFCSLSIDRRKIGKITGGVRRWRGRSVRAISTISALLLTLALNRCEVPETNFFTVAKR